MGTVDILKKYRLSLLEDEMLFSILAIIFRNGPIRSNEISSILDLDLSHVETRLRSLFRASLAKRNRKNQWNVTDAGDIILAGLGITTETSVSLLAETDLPSDDSVFLKLCISQSDELQEWSLLQSSFLKFLVRCVGLDSSKDPQHGRLAYAFLVGLHPKLMIEDEKWFCHSHLKGASDSSLISRVQFAKLSEKQDYFESKCKRARQDCVESNFFLIHGRPREEKDSDLVHRFSWARLTASLICKTSDSEMSSLRMRSFNFPKAWLQLYKWSSPVESITCDMLKQLGKNFPEHEHKERVCAAPLSSRMTQCLEDYRPVSQWPSSFNSGKNRPYSRLKNLLDAILAIVQRGQFDDFKPSEKQDLLVLIRRVEKCLSDEFGEIDTDGS